MSQSDDTSVDNPFASPAVLAETESLPAPGRQLVVNTLIVFCLCAGWSAIVVIEVLLPEAFFAQFSLFAAIAPKERPLLGISAVLTAIFGAIILSAVLGRKINACGMAQCFYLATATYLFMIGGIFALGLLLDPNLVSKEVPLALPLRAGSALAVLSVPLYLGYCAWLTRKWEKQLKQVMRLRASNQM